MSEEKYKQMLKETEVMDSFIQKLDHMIQECNDKVAGQRYITFVGTYRDDFAEYFGIPRNEYNDMWAVTRLNEIRKFMLQFFMERLSKYGEELSRSILKEIKETRENES